MTIFDIKQKIIELKDWFNYKYREYNEKLIRRNYLSIECTINDENRKKVYNSLNDLYLEAEKVVEEIHYYEKLLEEKE